MNRGLMAKTLREVWFSTLLLALALTLIKAALAVIMSTFKEMGGDFLKYGFVQNMLEGFLGAEVDANFGPDIVASVTWVHTVVLALVWAHGITVFSRVPAGEVDRGTMDVLLSLPVSRTRVYTHEAIVCAACGLCVVAMAWTGDFVGVRLSEAYFTHTPGRSIAIAANLYCLYLAVAGMTALVSSVCASRGRVVAIVLGLVLASFLLNFLAQFWGPGKAFSFLGVLNYYRPLAVMRGGAWPWKDMLILAGTGIAFWSVGAMLFVRRDIR